MDAFDRGIIFYICFMIFMIGIGIITDVMPTNITWITGLVFATWFAFKDVVK